MVTPRSFPKDPGLPALVAGALLAGVAGCGVPFGAPLAEGPVNTCSSDADCAPAGAQCVQGACAATQFDLTGALVEVRPTPGTSFGAGTSFLVDPKTLGVQLSSGGKVAAAFVQNLTVDLPKPISIRKGKVLFDASTMCHAAAEGVPASLTFYRKPPIAGIPIDPVTVSTTTGAVPTFDIDLVPGLYDVYIVPAATPACPNGAVPYPPVYVQGSVIDAGGAVVWTLPPYGALAGKVDGLMDPTKWKIDVVEPIHGLPISSNGKLSGTGPTLVSAQIAWTDPTVTPILRLTPLDPAPAAPVPTVYWSLQGAIFGGTTTNPMVSFEVSGLQTSGVEVTGEILSPDTMTGVAAELSFQSTSIGSGDNASNAAYTLSSVSTLTVPGTPGNFSVVLPPGDYNVRAVPTVDQTLSVTSFQLVWPKTWQNCVCGRSFTLEAKAKLAGTVRTPTGEPLGSTAVVVAPSLTAARSYLADTHTLDPAETRGATATTDPAGGFSLLADLGSTLLSVQPDPSTKFPWLVRPRIAVSRTTRSSTFTLTTPAFLNGTVVDPYGMPVADAEVNVWVPTSATGTTESTPPVAVQIATTSTDANGAFALVLPASL